MKTSRSMPTLTPKKAHGNIRMQDVADIAGVSLATVSRVFNYPHLVKPETLAVVRSACDKLNYVPNMLAGSLASNRSGIVAAIVPTLANSFFSETIDALSVTLTQQGYQLLLGHTFYCPDNEKKLVSAFMGRRVEGFVLTGGEHARGLRTTLKKSGIPVIEVWDTEPKPIDMMVGFSHTEVGRQAARYLIAKGHTSFGFIGSAHLRSTRRLVGFQEVIHEHGLSDVVIQNTQPPSSVADGADGLQALLERAPDVSAIFCGSDMVAAGAQFQCWRMGYRVPEHIALMGFSDMPIAGEKAANLTTLRVDGVAIGEHAGNMLLSRLSGTNDHGSHIDLGTTVIARASA